MKTYIPKNDEQNWVVVDATNVPLGRLATLIASRIRGKHRPDFTPNMIQGDFVVVLNAEKVALTGNKREAKLAYRHSGYPGGLRSTPYAVLLEKHPEKAVEKAIKGMLPHNTLGRNMAKKLKVYAGPEHPHKAQSPEPFEIIQVAQ